MKWLRFWTFGLKRPVSNQAKVICPKSELVRISALYCIELKNLSNNFLSNSTNGCQIDVDTMNHCLGCITMGGGGQCNHCCYGAFSS